MATDLQIFFSQHPLFHINEIREKLNFGSENTLKNTLKYHLKQGHIKRIKRGLYAVIGPGRDPERVHIDEYLIASKLAKDAVIGYQSALGYWGLLYSIRNEIIYLTKEDNRKFYYDGVFYKAVNFPKKLIDCNQEFFGVESVDRLGENILITSLERTFVDILDRFYLIHSWEEVYRAFESIKVLDLNKVIEYTLLLGNHGTTAKVGFFLEQFKETWFVEEIHLNKLKKNLPKLPLKIDRKKPGKYISKWNIIVPETLLLKDWEEPYEDV